MGLVQPACCELTRFRYLNLLKFSVKQKFPKALYTLVGIPIL